MARIAVTGTPGTGKTSAVELVETDLDVIHLNELIEAAEFVDGYDVERESAVADIDAITAALADRVDILVESHLAHYASADRVVVLRCHPAELERRLLDRGESEAKAAENAEAEALDVILTEAVERHGPDQIYEIETTEIPPAAVAEAIEAVIAGDREPQVGTVSFLDYL